MNNGQSEKEIPCQQSTRPKFLENFSLLLATNTFIYTYINIPQRKIQVFLNGLMIYGPINEKKNYEENSSNNEKSQNFY